MNEKLLLIKEQLEQLTNSINDYLESTNQDVIIIQKENFDKIHFLGETRHGSKVLDFNNGAIFILYLGFNYQKLQYTKLMDGSLNRLIIKKRANSVSYDGRWVSNYELESEEETKLRDLYKK